MKKKLKEKAIKLRKEGLSYSEIMKIIPIAKSTLSDWLHSVGLSKKQKQRITEKKLASIKRGWEKVRKIRLDRTQNIFNKSKEDISKLKINKDSLFLMGLMLYWAEGAKQKENRVSVSQGVNFSNSDPKMVTFFINWLRNLKITEDSIVIEIYIHENKRDEMEKVKSFWANATGIPLKKFDRIYYKKHNVRTIRKKIGENYFGLLRVRIKKSTDLNRRITGWINALSS